MSSARLWTEEQFNCPVCLDLPTDPVTIPCGHSYCMDCIADHWDNEAQKSGTCSCPECRHTFDHRPQLCRNTMLAEIHFKALLKHTMRCHYDREIAGSNPCDAACHQLHN
uniref:RING-type domain-containing protein n=1 Tax=Astyanax mexicanus TaxID=7994 RepID=A0A8B9RHH6_ASTMX